MKAIRPRTAAYGNGEHSNVASNTNSHRHLPNQSNYRGNAVEISNRKQDFFDDFTFDNFEGIPIELKRFRGRATIVTNIGTFAPNAKSELEELNSLCHCFGENLLVLGIPSNHFYNEPAANSTETLAVMQHVRPGTGFRPNPMSFFVTSHADVNGSKALPIVRFLKKALPMPSDDQFSFAPSERITWSPIERSDITMDFEKFIVRPDGKPLRRYSGNYPASNLYHDLQRLIDEFSLCPNSANLSSARYSRSGNGEQSVDGPQDSTSSGALSTAI